MGLKYNFHEGSIWTTTHTHTTDTYFNCYQHYLYRIGTESWKVISFTDKKTLAAEIWPQIILHSSNYF